MTTAQIVLLTTDQVSSLTSTQLRGLTSANLQAIETADIRALTTTQLAKFSTSMVQYISSAQLEAMTTTQLIGLSTASIYSVMTTAQTSGLNTCQIGALLGSSVDPLVLDLNGDGIANSTSVVGSEATFNVAGIQIATGWLGAGDGMLVTDKDFGSNTLQSFGELLPKDYSAVNGPTGLMAIDKNHDGVINSKDAGYKDLAVYTYNNGEGKLQTLSELNITSISVNMSSTNHENNGNLIGLMGAYTTSDGVTHSMADLAFQIAPVVDILKVIKDTRVLVDTGHVDLTKVDTAKHLSVTLQDVLAVGENLSGIHQLTVNGNASDTLHLAGSASGWHSAGTVADGADSYAVYVNANAQLMVNDKIHIVIG
jgi:hypothetical protein